MNLLRPSVRSRLAKFLLSIASAHLAWVVPAAAQLAPNRYAIILSDEAPARRFASRDEIQGAAAQAYQRQIETAQRTLRAQLEQRKIRVTGTASLLLNAVFIAATPDRVAEIQSLPGVLAVVPQRIYKPLLNRADGLINGPAAWQLSGGFANAGKGIRIAIIDTGVDQMHPALQDPTLPMPPGFPKCDTPPPGQTYNDCAFTNSKVIVARSYIAMQGAGTDPSNPSVDSKADDFSARDRQGHGTNTASTAAGNTAVGAVTINGMAPKAYIGNYKIFGSTGVVAGGTTDAIVAAIEDAVRDGMDVLSMSFGQPAFTAPFDTGAACTGANGGVANAPGIACDLIAAAIEAAIRQGVVAVVAAGNAGQSGVNPVAQTLNTVGSPGYVPDVITSGASTNSHDFISVVSVTGAGVPASLNSIAAVPAPTAAPGAAITAPLADVATLGNDGYACAALPPGSLKGQLALIERGPASSPCLFSLKMSNALAAGAVGVVFYMADQSQPIPAGGLTAFNAPAAMISNSDGASLKNYIDANAGHPVTLSPLQEQVLTTYNQLAPFSSSGPTLGTYAMKPDVLAPGRNMYMATQSFDPLGELYSPNGYTVADGTSYSTPMTSGAVALVKQAHPGYTPAQIKSALLNTATQEVAAVETGAAVNVLQTGAGKVATDAAIANNLTVSPPSVSFGALTGKSVSASQQFQVTNTGSSTVNLSLAVVSGVAVAGTTLALDHPALSLAAGASGTFTLTLSGSVPAAGVYSGAVTLQGGGQTTRVPYMFLVGTGTVNDLIPLSGDGNDGTVNQIIPDTYVAFMLIDSSGVPVAGHPVSFTADAGLHLSQVSTVTDAYGIAYATVTMGPTPGAYSVTGCAASPCTRSALSYQFSEFSRVTPQITAAGVVDAASFRQPIAPGSYIAIFGSNLTDASLTPAGSGVDQNSDARLPLNIDYTQVSFDVPSAGISVPGRIAYISSGQLVAQVPWELAGQKAAQVKVTINNSFGNVVTVPLSDYAPALFESSGVAIAVDASGNLITASNPAGRGQPITLYANGLGPVSNPPASGDPALGSPLSWTTTMPVVTIGGQSAGVPQFSGLTPTLPGLYQINLTVPQNIAAGTLPIAITIGGQTSKSSTIPVR